MSNPMNLDPGQQGQKVEIDLDAYVQTLVGQRNSAMDTVAQQQGLIARLQKQLAELKDQLINERLDKHKPNGDAREEVRAT